jgi:hypothetical protein
MSSMRSQRSSTVAPFESLEERRLFAVSFDTYLIGPSPDLAPIASAADGQGNVLVLGTFKGSVDFNPSSHKRYVIDGTSAGGADSYFVAKYSAKGGLYWVVPIRANNAGVTTPGLDSIAADSKGNFFLAGTLDGTIDADPGRKVRLRSPESDSDGILLHFRHDTKLVGATVVPLDGNTVNDVTQLKIDAQGNAYVGGTYTSTGGGDDFGYVAKVSRTGNFSWWNNTSDGVGVALGLDRADAPVLVTQSGTASSMAITRYAATNGKMLTRQLLTTSASTAGAITPVAVDFDAKNDPLIAGNLTGFADFDPSNSAYVLGPKLATDPSSNVFFAKYTPRGKLLFARVIGSTGNDVAAGLAIDRATGNFFVAGSFDNAVDFDPGRSGVFIMDTGDGSDAANALSDMFVAKFTDLGAFLNAAQLEAPRSRDIAVSFSLAPKGRVYVLGDSSRLSTNDAISLFDTIR